MSGDDMKKVRTGDPMRIPADTYNNFIDAARTNKETGTLFRSGALNTSLAPGTTLAYNASGEDAPFMAVVELKDLVASSVTLEFTKPGTAGGGGVFTIALEPIATGRLGVIAVAGAPYQMMIEAESCAVGDLFVGGWGDDPPAGEEAIDPTWYAQPMPDGATPDFRILNSSSDMEATPAQASFFSQGESIALPKACIAGVTLNMETSSVASRTYCRAQRKWTGVNTSTEMYRGLIQLTLPVTVKSGDGLLIVNTPYMIASMGGSAAPNAQVYADDPLRVEIRGVTGAFSCADDDFATLAGLPVTATASFADASFRLYANNVGLRSAFSAPYSFQHDASYLGFLATHTIYGFQLETVHLPLLSLSGCEPTFGTTQTNGTLVRAYLVRLSA